LPLDGLLQFDVALVGNVQRHLEFGDLDVQLLLDASNLGLEPGLSLHDANVELLDLDAGLLAEKQEKENVCHKEFAETVMCSTNNSHLLLSNTL